MEKAKAVHEGLNLLNLNLKLVGDQDLAAGIESFNDITKDAKYTFIISNLSEGTNISHQKFKHYQFHEHHLFFIGVVNPETIQQNLQKIFNSPEESIKNMIKELKDNHQFDPSNQNHHLILLSHSGQRLEKTIAEKFEEIDWILGSHSMNFTQKPLEIKKTKLAQMLSRNHYLGKISYQKGSRRLGIRR